MLVALLQGLDGTSVVEDYLEKISKLATLELVLDIPERTTAMQHVQR